MLHQFSVLFFLYKSKTNCKGYAPVFCRITLNGDRKQFSTGSQLKENSWNVDKQRYKGVSVDAKIVNDNLEELHRKIMQAYNEMLKEKVMLYLDDIYNRFTGRDKQPNQLHHR